MPGRKTKIVNMNSLYRLPFACVQFSGQQVLWMSKSQSSKFERPYFMVLYLFSSPQLGTISHLLYVECHACLTIETIAVDKYCLANVQYWVNFVFYLPLTIGTGSSAKLLCRQNGTRWNYTVLKHGVTLVKLYHMYCIPIGIWHALSRDNIGITNDGWIITRSSNNRGTPYQSCTRVCCLSSV